MNTKQTSAQDSSIADYQFIIEEIDYMIASTTQLRESLNTVCQRQLAFPNKELEKIRVGCRHQFHKIREFKHLLGNWRIELRFVPYKTEIKDYLFLLDDLESQTSTNVQLAAKLAEAKVS
ncbi:hypothetical protein [Teredinibacter sp. KSP-S5-2]|uniref:hypothetical protein n=1 Tax=Teredinibacter sp. KSP-S5-2 TaxID=3034506 RepID=UPI0029349B44|nr:hypothetical protein [Teredinibacter sp. KSP-S5-2]WNO11408.1 hypothetical protein P5V12_09515 [Teredinibacter sp. KSP-S5-2]